MIGRDGHGDPIPPGHAEPRRHEDGKVYELGDIPVPFDGGPGPAWRPAPIPAEQFGVPLCRCCRYYHRPEETCR